MAIEPLRRLAEHRFARAGIPELFVVVGLLLGVPYALWMGPLRIPDESGHFYRAFTVSRGACIGEPAVASAADWRDLANETIWTQLPPHSTAPDVLRLIRTPQDAQGGGGLFTVSNLYSCIPYLASGFAVRAGGWITSSWLSLMYFGRLANLAVYLALIYAALRMVPAFRLIIAAVALMPMALHQAASLSSDSPSIAIAFLWTAFVLKLALDPQPKVLAKSDHLFLITGILIAALIKANAGLVFLTLLIPAAKFPSRRARALSLAGYILLAYCAAASWNYLNRANVDIFVAVRSAAGISVPENVRFVLHHPLLWLAAMARTIAFFKAEYVEEFVGTLGWLTIRLPVWVVWIYLVGLVGAALTQASGVRLTAWQRGVLAGVFVFNAVSLFIVIWTCEMPLSGIRGGREILSGVQGRYLISFAPLLLIALSGTKSRVPARYATTAVLVLVLAANLTALRLVWNTYQEHTSTLPNRFRIAWHLLFTDAPQTAALRFEERLIQRRGFSPGDERVYLVYGGVKHELQGRDWVMRKGYKWPDDVLIVSGADLDAIPTGEAMVSPAAAMLWVHDSREQNQQMDGPRTPSAYAFETFHIRFVATGTGAIRIHLHMAPGPGRIVWNHVRLVRLRGEAAPFLRNADFTDGTLTPWMYYGKVQWKLPIRAGGNNPAEGIEEKVGDGGVCQDVTGLIPGQTYEVSAMARSVGE